MRAVWACRSGNPARIGCYLDRTCSCGIRRTISRTPRSGFEPRIIHKHRILPHVMSCNLHQRHRCSKCSRMLPSGEIEMTGRYRIVQKLGEGGMGIVYAAHDDRLDRPVAIKRIRPGLSDGQERQRLWREARAVASVNHPNVCQLYEIDEDGEGLFLAMELLEGEALSARLARGALGPNEAVQIALAVLNALAALHQKGIVHRDLKPSNIFLSPHAVKLLDFGLARPFVRTERPGESDLTMPGVVLGTPRYMAPEMIEGRVVDARADLFV